jgi:hypothetical protein
MAGSLRIFILEDNRADAELIQFKFQEAGGTFTAKVVMSEDRSIENTRKRHGWKSRRRP